MKFGIFLPSRGSIASLEVIRETALAAERLGFDSVWAGDHLSFDHDFAHYGWSYQSDDKDTANLNFYEVHTTLSYVAGLTEQIMIGTAILALPLRDPRVFAKEVMTLQALSGGRLVLGVGLGDYVGDFELVEKSKSNRAALTDEYLDVLTTLLEGGELSYQGKTINVKKAVFYPKVPKIPILYGGGFKVAMEDGELKVVLAEKPLERAARWCDGMIPYGPPQLMADCDRKMREIAADKYGRKPSFGTVATVNTLVAETDNEAQDAIRPYIENSPFPITDESGDVIGSPETVVAAFQKFADLGINHFNIMCRTKTLEEQLRMMELISKEVTPHFKG